jgi:CDP-diacylglycerol---serine O-phosphatidyltransferase
MTKQIPNLFTLANLIFGCIAVVLALQTFNVNVFIGEDALNSTNLPENLSLAALFIYAAAVVDFLDGFVARMCKVSSEMGKQLDSLADVVSFGVAPGVILYQMLRMSFMKEENGLAVSIIWLLPAFVLTAAAAYRLAKFNLDTTQSYGFKGIPTPAAGLLIASLPLIFHYGGGLVVVNELLVNKWLLYGIIIIVSWLMVSNLPMLAMKFKDFSIANNMPRVLLLIIGILAAIFLKWLAVPVIFIAYIILSLAFKNKTTS